VFGLQGLILSSFLLAFDLPKRAYIATGGAIALMIDIFRLSVYWLRGVHLSDELTLNLVFFLTACLLGALTARVLVDYIPQKWFRPVIGMTIMILGLKLALFG
jgi:uncharacterized membrane protein YfcA